MFITLIVVMVPWVFVYGQTHQIVHIKYVQFFLYQFYFNKTVKKKDTVDSTAYSALASPCLILLVSPSQKMELGFLFTMSFVFSALIVPLNLHWLNHSCWQVNERIIYGYNSHIARVEYAPVLKVPSTIQSVYSNLHHNVSRMQLALDPKVWFLVEGRTEAQISFHWFVSISCCKMER